MKECNLLQFFCYAISGKTEFNKILLPKLLIKPAPVRHNEPYIANYSKTVKPGLQKVAFFNPIRQSG
jgi:hypothetical protein